MTRRTICKLLLLLLALIQTCATYAADQKYLVFVGTYTGKGSDGIYSYRFDPSTGKVDALGLASEDRQPIFSRSGAKRQIPLLRK